MIELMDYPNAQRTVRDCVCSLCWGVLVMHPAADRLFKVECADCKHDTVGYVTKHYVDECRHKSAQDLKDAKKTLEDVGVIAKPEKKTTEQLIKELGF